MLMRTPAPWVRPKRLQPPGFIVPCQPTLAHKVPVGDGWIHELKHDGFRILAFKDGDTVRLWSRNGRDWSGEFVAITEALAGAPVKARDAGRRGGKSSHRRLQRLCCKALILPLPARSWRPTCSNR